MKRDSKIRAKYFRKQKILGGILIALGVLSVILLEGDATAAVFMIPVGLCMIFTKELLYMDDYLYELEEAKKFDKWKES